MLNLQYVQKGYNGYNGYKENYIVRERRMLISAIVFPGLVWRNSLYQRRKTLVTPISSSDGSTTELPW
jgi:hypothetical protein